MKILIAGTGAVGGYYGAKLALGGEEVTFLARGATLEALRKKDLVVRSFRGDFRTPVRVIADIHELSAPDLILISVKSYDTDLLLEQIKPVVASHTLLIPLQNGVESEYKIATAFGNEKVLGSVCYIGAEVIEPGVIVHNAEGTIAIGELSGLETKRLKNIVEIFQKCGIEAYSSPHIRKERWVKLGWNTAFNQICTIAHASVGDVLNFPEIRELIHDTMKEVYAVAQKSHVLLEDDLIKKSIQFSDEALRLVRPSMLQDFEKGRRLEHETFAGFIVREGKRLGVPTPINRILYNFLCFMDSSSLLREKP